MKKFTIGIKLSSRNGKSSDVFWYTIEAVNELDAALEARNMASTHIGKYHKAGLDDVFKIHNVEVSPNEPTASR